MQRRLKLFILTVIGTSFFAVACAPKQQRLQIDHPPQDFQPKVADADVKAQGLYNMDFDQSVTVKSQVTPAFVYRLSENMMSLGASQHHEALSTNGQKVLNKLLDLPGLATTVPASNSPFVQLAISETREEVNEALTEVDQQLKASVDQLNQTLVQLGKTYPWPTGASSLTQAGQTIAGFLGEFLAQANQLNIFDALKSQLQIEIANQQKWIEDLTTQIDQELHSAKHFPELMAYLQKLLKDQQITPPPDLQKTLDQGVLLAQDLSNCNSEQSVLTAIVDVWNILDDQQRVQYIKPESESLYNYLKKSDAKDLQCLRTAGCMNPMKFVIKKFFILPKISKMGVAKVCASIDQSALSYVVTTSQTKVSQVYPQMPSFVSDALNKAIADKMKILNTIHQDYSGFLKKQIQQWATQNLLGKGQVRGVDVGNLQVSLKDKALQLQVVAGPATAEAFGSSMAALTQYYNDPNAEMNRVQQSSFDLVNKLVALGGYTTEYGTLTPALLTPLDKAAPLLDLTHLTSQTAPYGLPDQFNVVNSFVPKEIHPAQFSMSARSQAELIRGLSKVIGYLSDWRTSAYDQTLGGITAATLVPDYKDVNELQRAMFPKA